MNVFSTKLKLTHLVRDDIKTHYCPGITEETTRWYSSPTVTVPKPDGPIRICNNFRHPKAISTFNKCG